MFKMQYPTDHLKKEGVNSKITELSDEMQYIEQAKEFPQFKRYRRSDSNSESESRFKRIDVPGDGSCLFWSVTMAYLIPVRNNDALFRRRYKALFGNKEAVIQNLDHIRGLVRNLGTANYDDTFANLVRNVFRNRVVDHISSHRNEFRGFIEGNFESYLENMRKPNAWGGEPEIRAMSGMLRATISVAGATESRYENGNIQIQLFHVGAPGKRNHYNFGLERGTVDNDVELAKGLKKVMGKGRPQDFELIQLLIEEAGTEVGTSKQEEDFRSFETRFQSFVDQIPSYLHSVEKAGFFAHFFLGSFSTLLDTKIAERLNIKKIYFSFDTSKTLKVAIVKNGQIGNAEDAINNIDLFSISEGKRGHQFTVNELESILRNNIDRSKIRDRNVEQNIKNEIQDRIKSRLVQIYKGKDGIFVNMEVKEILDSPASKEFHEIEKGVWSNPEGDIEKLANSDKEAAKESLEGILREISKVHSKYENSLTYDSSAREAAHHGFMVGVFMNFHYRYNLRVYPEQFAGRGYADIILLARGPDRALDSIPIIIELKAGEGPNATPDKALQQAERYAQGFQPNVQRVLTTADNILCVGVNLDNPSPISDIKVSNRGEEIIPLFQDMLKSADDWDTQRIGTIELKGQVKDNLERIYHTFPGTPEKGDNHYFSRFLLGQSLLLNRVEDLKTGFKKYIFIYGDNIPTEVHPNLRGLRRLAAERARERLSANLDASHAVVTMVLIPENTEKLVYVINIVEANRKDVLNGMNEVLPLDRLNREIENREIVELNLNFDTRYKSDFKRYLTIWTEKYNSLQEYNNGAERFQGTFREVPYPSELKETFDEALDAYSSSIDEYNELLGKIGEGIFPFKSLVNKEAHFQGILNGVFSYYSDLKLQELPETRALVLTEFQTGGGERIDMLVHGIKFVAQGGNAEEYTPIGLELKTSRQGKGAQALLREANDQINEEYKEGVTYKTLTDGDEVKFIGVVFDKGSNDPRKLILTSRTNREGFIPLKVVHSSHTLLPHLRRCSKRESSSPEYPPSKKPRRERSVNMACMDSFDEEKITEEEKEQRIKELFNADKVAERVKNIEFYDQLFKVSQKISEGEIIDKNVEEAFVAKIKDIDLDSIDPEIRDIVKEMKDNIENKEEVKNILRRSGVAEKMGKVAEGAGLAFTAFLVGKHIANGDIEGLGYDALNLWIMPKIGEKISGKMLELGTNLDSQMLRGFAPVMGRAIGNFAAFLGLAESIKARQSATDPVDIKIADLNIATNSIFIAADVPAVVTETMSAIGMEAGVVGEFAGPVGAAVSVAVIIISQFVEAGLEVEKLGEHIKLTDQEKHDLYWDFFLDKKVPDYIGNDLQAEEIYKQYISKILDQFKGSYDKIAISLPSILLTEEKYLDGSIFRRKREVMQSDDASAYLGITPCFRHTRIVDNKFDFRLITRVSDISLNVKSGNNHISRLLPSTMKNYSAICGPKGDDVDLTVISEKTLQRVEGVAQCGYRSEYENMVLSTTVKKVSLKEYLPGCQNAILYSKSSSSRLPANMLFYIPNNDAFINVTSNYTVDVIFNGKNILLNSYGINNQGSSVQNRYYFTNQLSNCDIHKQGTNFFYIAKDNFVCNLGIEGQKNIVVTQGNFTDSENIHSIIGSDKANYIEVSYAGYVDGKGGNDVITAKNLTTIKGYFGDSIYGKGLVLLPINLNDIGNVIYANNITNIYNKSGNFISIDKQTLVKTADGSFVTPTKVDTNTGRVTNVQITKLDDELDDLRKIDNSNFNITKQLSSANYHSTIGSSSNHIFYPDKEHHNFYWEAPSNISHLYLFDNRNANITIAQANGILDFSQLNCTLDDIPFIENKKGEIKINKNGLNVTLLPDYKDITVTFDGEEYYKFQNGELERDYCSHSLKIDGRFSVNGTDLLNHHNCFTFDSDKVLFLKLKNDLLLLSDRGALSISGYYSSVHKNWDLSVELNNRIIEPEEFGERADSFSSFRYYQPDEQGLQIYHNQPVNKNDIGLIDLKGQSILDFNMRVMNDTLLLSHKNNTLVKVENWDTYQPAREVMFAFNDAIVSNSKCIVSICNSEDVIVEFNKEKLVLSTEELFDAVKQNNLDKVKELINQGANINAQEKGIYGKKPIHIAAENNNKNIIEFLLSRGVSVNDTERVGNTPLHYAAWGGRLEAAEFLVNKGADIDAADASTYGKKPVHVAAENNNKNIIEFLLNRGVSVDDTERVGNTPLHYAAWRGCLEAAEFLVNRRANINAADNSGKKPVHVAAENNNKNIIEFLLSKGVSVNEADKNGSTPLHYASWNGCLDVVEYLIGKGADISVKDLDVAIDRKYGNIVKYLKQAQLNEQLLNAVQDDDLNEVKNLIGKGASVNARDKDGKTPLGNASSNSVRIILMQAHLDKELLLTVKSEKDLKTINDLIAKDIGDRTHGGFYYAWSGNLDTVDFLVGRDLSVNATDKYDCTLLHWAALKGHSDIVKFLVDKGANVNAKDILGRTPMHFAVTNNHMNITEFLLKNGANVDEADKNGWTPLHWAALEDCLEVAKFLVDKGADVNAKDIYGKKPIHRAATVGYRNIIEFLLSKGVSVDEIDNGWTRTALHWASDGGYLDVVKYLINKGANINAKDKDDQTPLDLAIQGNYTDIVGLLKQTQLDKKLLTAIESGDLSEVRKFVSQGANVNAIEVGIFGRKPIHIAAEKNYKDIIEFLLGKGVSVDDISNYGWTPLHYTASKDCLGVAKFLVDKGANINAQNVYGREPIHIAAEHDNKNIIELLLNKGISVNEVDKDGWMPLHWASWNGHLDIIEYLVGKGADINAKDKNGKTPLDIARDKGHNNIVKRLEKEINKKREKPAQRKRRHHHGDHNHQHGHLSRNLLATDSSNQPEIAASSGARPSSWINDLFSWVKSSVGGLLSSALPKETSSTPSPISQPIDINGTIMLLDVLIRKVTGQKYISTVYQSISPLEAQGYALNITKGFEKVVEQAGLKSGVSMHRLNIDFVEIQKEVTGKIMSGKFDEISGVLNSYLEEACPGKEAGCPGKLSPKKFEKFIAQFNKGLLNQSIEQILHDRDGTLEVGSAKQMSLEPQSYLSNASVHSHSEVSTCLSEIGVTKLRGNLNR
ncbi:ankyrin repeat domain-containing protein [Wolbachia endosymbiont (group A) of Beris morrisii]|uniref:ankyrin repeat domain-containing protein n=1 Tax=Wolbachia endosymbiont (group A) of Beris morrisii TaxID=3066139 RepID=UPI0033407C1E